MKRIAALWLLFLPLPALAVDLYVRPDGSDSACNGRADAASSSAPNCAFREVRACINAMAAGDRCLTAPGDYEADMTISKSGATASLSGTVQCTHGSTNVTGVGTRFGSELRTGDYVRCDANPGPNQIDYRVQGYFPWTRVASVQSDTQLTLEEGYRGVTDSSGAGDDTRGRFLTIEGTGARPRDTRITHLKTLAELGITPTRYTGFSGDCDARSSSPGTQACQNIYTFVAPYSSIYAPNTSGHNGIMQGDYDVEPAVPVTQVAGQNFGTELFFNPARIRQNTCSNATTDVQTVEVWPGSYTVQENYDGNGNDRWLYHPRNDAGKPGGADDILIGVSRRMRVNGNYIIFRNISTWAAWNGGDEHAATGGVYLDGGVVIGSGASHLQFRDYEHHGNRWGGVSRNTSNTHIVIEDGKLLYGYCGYLGSYSGMYNVQVRRSTKGFNGSAGSNIEGAGTVFDRVWHANSMAYFYDPSCTNNRPAVYHWLEGTTDGYDVGGTHGFYINMGLTDEAYAYAWVINSVIEGTSDGLSFASTGGKFKVYNNTFGRDARSLSEDTMFRPDRTNLGGAGGTTEVYNNAFLDYDSRGPTIYYWNEAGYLARHEADYNAYIFQNGGVPLKAGGSRSLTALRADGHEAHGLDIQSAVMSSIFVDPDYDGNRSDYTPREGAAVIDAGVGSKCPSYDFYGNPRNDARCDIGAVERQGGGGGGNEPPSNVTGARRADTR